MSKRNSLGKIYLFGIVLFIVNALTCSQSVSPDFEGEIRIKLVDSPSSYDQIIIIVRRVEIHRSGNAADLGWRVINDEITPYDLLKLRNGLSDTLALRSVPIGQYDQIKLLLGISSVVVNGVIRTLNVPANFQQDGFKISYPFEIEEGKQYQLTLDFDATRSVRQTVPNVYELNPVVRAQNALISGSISGAVDPPNSRSVILTTVQGDTVSTSADTTQFNGSFQLVDLPEGTYSITVSPTSVYYRDTTITGVQVIRLTDKKLGTILLPIK